MRRVVCLWILSMLGACVTAGNSRGELPSGTDPLLTVRLIGPDGGFYTPSVLDPETCPKGRYGSTSTLEIVDGSFRTCRGVDSSALGDWPTE